MNNTAIKTATALTSDEIKQVRHHLATYSKAPAASLIERLLAGGVVVTEDETKLLRDHVSAHEVNNSYSCSLIARFV